MSQPISPTTPFSQVLDRLVAPPPHVASHSLQSDHWSQTECLHSMPTFIITIYIEDDLTFSCKKFRSNMDLGSFDSYKHLYLLFRRYRSQCHRHFRFDNFVIYSLHLHRMKYRTCSTQTTAPKLGIRFFLNNCYLTHILYKLFNKAWPKLSQSTRIECKYIS